MVKEVGVDAACIPEVRVGRLYRDEPVGVTVELQVILQTEIGDQ